MLDDIRKSISSILYERVTSPLFGTLIITWLIWNWRIVYLTFFVSESKITGTKIDYIISNLYDPWVLYWYPLISTLFLITAVPFISNGSFWLSVWFRKWRIERKQELENKQLLSLEQSIELRTQIKNQEENFEKLIAGKEEEIEVYKSDIKKLNVQLNEQIEISKKPKKEINIPSTSYGTKDYIEFKQKTKAFNMFGEIAQRIRAHNKIPEIPDDIREFYLINGIFNYNEEMDFYNLTEKGNSYYQIYFNEKFDDKSSEIKIK